MRGYRFELVLSLAYDDVKPEVEDSQKIIENEETTKNKEADTSNEDSTKTER